MLRTETGKRAMADLAMAENCMRHERMFFQRPSTATAVPGTFNLAPHAAMRELLRNDYQAMAIMIFGDVLDFDVVLASITDLQSLLNAT
jgi:hypothetical protein